MFFDHWFSRIGSDFTSPALLKKNIEFSRIILGLFLFLKYFDSYLLSMISPDLENFYLLGSILGLCVTCGILTPLVCLTLIYQQAYHAHLGNLANQVVIITMWAFIWLGAGQYFSLDSWLLKKSQLGKKFKGWLYVLALPASSKALGMVRFSSVMMFAGVSYLAMSYHFQDPLWIKGNILQILYLTPYLSNLYEFAQWMSSNYPEIYHYSCKAALYTQGFWELFALPLLFFRYGRLFLAVQGLLFFIVSIVSINLSFLPWFELALWVLLFNFPFVRKEKRKQRVIFFDDKCNLCHKTIAMIRFFDIWGLLTFQGFSRAPQEAMDHVGDTLHFLYRYENHFYSKYNSYLYISQTTFPFIFLWPIFKLGQLSGIGQIIYNFVEKRRRSIWGVCEFAPQQQKIPVEQDDKKMQYFLKKLFIIAVALPILYLCWTSSFVKYHKYFRRAIHHFEKPLLLIAQTPVDVFNRNDMKMGERTIVIVEENNDGSLKRVLPFMDHLGGRLKYLRNDYIYFRRSLTWQRNNDLARFVMDSAQEKPSTLTDELVKMIIKVDACYNQKQALDLKYRAYFIKREKDHSRFKDLYTTWSAPQVTSTASYHLKQVYQQISQDKLVKKCHSLGMLNSGFLYEQRRILKTKEFIEQYSISGKPMK